jgi:predicted regulator of Ras-like GTPase activity (Roadblock/LC7/MglB family)
MDPAQALADLTEISSQIRAAVILDAAGKISASTLSDDATAERVARAARELLEAAEEVRRADGEPRLAQLEAATPAGSVFVVREGEQTIAAATSAEPTVGLVFYDLKSCLRSAVAEEAPNARRRTTRRKTESASETEGDGPS